MSNKLDLPIISRKLFAMSNSCKEDGNSGEKFVFTRNSNSSIICYFFKAEPDSPVLIFFPAAAGSPLAFASQAESFTKHGMSIMYVTYEASSHDGPTPDFSYFTDNARYIVGAVIDQLAKDKTIHFFIMGQSLGSVFAIDAALNNSEKVKGLILDSAVCKTKPFLERNGIDTSEFDLPESEGFNNLLKINKIELPTIIFHGSKDIVVQAAEAESLQACSGARSKQFFIIPGGCHGDLSTAGGDTYYTTLRNFINTTCGINTWRQRRKRFKTDNKA